MTSSAGRRPFGKAASGLVPADHPELYALLISVRQVLMDRPAHGAERGAAIRGECGEVLGHGGSCHVGDDIRLRKAEGRFMI